MDASSTATPGVTLTASFEKLFLSGVRLSSAATLFGVHQLETATSLWQESGGIGKQMDRMGKTFNSLTQCLTREISHGKKEALDSIAEMTTEVVRQSIDGISLLDPRRVFRWSTSLALKSTEMITGWSGKKESPAKEEPQLAADVLAN